MSTTPIKSSPSLNDLATPPEHNLDDDESYILNKQQQQLYAGQKMNKQNLLFNTTDSSSGFGGSSISSPASIMDQQMMISPSSAGENSHHQNSSYASSNNSMPPTPSTPPTFDSSTSADRASPLDDHEERVNNLTEMILMHRQQQMRQNSGLIDSRAADSGLNATIEVASNMSGSTNSNLTCQSSPLSSGAHSPVNEMSKSDYVDDQIDDENSSHPMASYLSLPLNLNSNTNNDHEFDPFPDYMHGNMDKLTSLQQSDISGSKKSNAADHQQMMALLAAAAASDSSGKQPRSLYDNIEALNSKFMNQSKSIQSHMDKNNTSNLLLASMAAAAAAKLDSMTNSNQEAGIGSHATTPVITNKRHSQVGFNSPAMLNSNILFSTPIPGNQESSPSNSQQSASMMNANSRLNSTPALNSMSNFNQSQNRDGNQMMPSIGKMMTHSNSAYTLNSNNNEMVSSSGYDDDDVFTTNNGNGNANSNASMLNNSQAQFLAGQIDQFTLQQLYKTLLSNAASQQNNNMNNPNAALLNELILNQTLNNLSNLSLLNGTNDVLNTNASANFLNMSNNSNASFNKNGNNQNAPASPNSSNLSPLVSLLRQKAAMQQQQQMNNNSNYGRGNGNNILNQGLNGNASNIAALASSSNNMASLISSQLQNANLNSDLAKRRVNSIATGYNSNPSSPQQQGQLGSGQIGPNTAHLLQNSSLASSARLNAGSTASVLGANSNLTHALNSLQLQQAVAAAQQQSPQSNNGGLLSNHHSSSNSLLSGNGNSSSNAALVASLNSSGKPLRSERLPQQLVDEIIKQGRMRRKQGGKKEVCVFCRNNGEKEIIYTSHTLKDAQNSVACPILRLYQCPICHASGDQAHTIKYCPYAEKDSSCLKMLGMSGSGSTSATNSANTSLIGGGSNGLMGMSSLPSTPSHMSRLPPAGNNLSLNNSNMAAFLSSLSASQNNSNANGNSSSPMHSPPGTPPPSSHNFLSGHQQYVNGSSPNSAASNSTAAMMNAIAQAMSFNSSPLSRNDISSLGGLNRSNNNNNQAGNNNNQPSSNGANLFNSSLLMGSGSSSGSANLNFK